MKSLALSCGWKLNLVINSDYDYNKRLTDEYEANLILNDNDKRILVCSDYLNFIVNEFLQKLKAIDTLSLLNVFEKHNIGIAYNDYLYRIDNEQELNQNYLLENDDAWIGMKYLLFELSQKSATWLYSENNKRYLEITPLYEKHFLDSDEASYNDFVSKYTVSEKIELSNQDIANLINLMENFV